MKKIPLLFLLLICLFGCEKKNDEKINQIKTIEFESTSKELLLSEIADSVTLVHLDSKEVIGEISELIFQDEHIVILDRYKTNKIFIFDSNGKLQTSISANGAGPGEFLWPRAILFTHDEKAIIVHCDRTKKILKFSLSGEFIEEWGVSKLGQLEDILSIENGFAIALKPESYEGEKILLVDNDFNLITEKDFSNLFLDSPFIEGGKVNFFYPKRNGKGFYYKGFLSNYMIEMDEDQIINVFNVNLPDPYEIDFEITTRSSINVLEESNNQGKVYWSDDNVDMGGYMVFSLVNSGNSSLAFWDKATNRAFFINKIINDISTIVNINGVWGSYNNSPGMLITALEPPVLGQLLSSVDIKNPIYQTKFSELTLSSEDNPVLIFYHFKSSIDLRKK